MPNECGSGGLSRDAVGVGLPVAGPAVVIRAGCAREPGLDLPARAATARERNA